MAKKGSNKARSVEQEEWVAKVYGGKRSPSSGAADTDQGDVRSSCTLFECKTTGGPGDKPKGGKLVSDFEKIADEAFSEARDPAICLRFWRPDSVLSDRDGYVNLTVRLTDDDAERSMRLAGAATGVEDAVEAITFGQGCFGVRCRLCKADDYAGSLVHAQTCPTRHLGS